MIHKIRKLCENKIERFATSIAAAGKSPDTEAIHRLRVNIKRIRAVLLFLNALGSAETKRQRVSQLRLLFRSAGKVREIQVSRILIRAYRSKGEPYLLYETFLKNEEKRARLAFVKAVAAFNRQKQNADLKEFDFLLSSVDKKNIDTQTRSFIRKHFRKVKRLMKKSKLRMDLHLVRKHMKILDAVISLILQLSTHNKYKKRIVPIRELNLKIGDLRDKQLLMSDIARFLANPNRLNPTDFRAYNSLIIRIRKETASALEPLEKELLAFCSQYKMVKKC